MEVGGDFYDAFSVGDRRWGLLIGDVAGKGAAAAATTAVVRYSARAAARFGTRLVVPSAVNDALLETEDEDDFCTLTYSELHVDDDGVELSVLNCGHPAPVLVRSDGTIRQLDCSGSLLGQFPDVAVGSLTCRLERGDAVVFVTDGVLEARRHEPASLNTDPWNCSKTPGCSTFWEPLPGTLRTRSPAASKKPPWPSPEAARPTTWPSSSSAFYPQGVRVSRSRARCPAST